MVNQIPYQQYNSGLDYNSLMQMLAMKKMMESQGQQQAAPNLSGAKDLFSVATGGGSGFGLGSLFGDGGSIEKSVFAKSPDLMSSTAPDYLSGFNISAGVPEATTPFSLSGIGSAGNGILPVAGAIGAYDLFKNKRTGGRGVLQGAASGAAMGSYFGVPGAIVGGVIGGTAGLANTLFDTDRFKKEGKRLSKLKEQGYNIPVELPMNLKMGRSKQELINKNYAADYIGNDSSGGWVNNKFAQSRNESDLRGEDLQGYAAILEKAGKDSTLQQRIDLANKALQAGAVNEHHGTVDVDWSKVSENSALKNPETKWQKLPAEYKPAILGTTSTAGFHPLAQFRSRTSSPGIDKNGRRISY